MVRLTGCVCHDSTLRRVSPHSWGENKTAIGGSRRLNRQKVRHWYRKDTLILETEFETEHGAVRLIDYMPPRVSYPNVVRIVEGIRGQVEMEMKLVVRFDYGNTIPWVQRVESQSILVAGPDALVLRSNVKTRGKNLSIVAEFSLAAGERNILRYPGTRRMKNRGKRSIPSAYWTKPKTIGPIGSLTRPAMGNGGIWWSVR